ncbi:MAG: TetR/AcrR family transcriptional regulator, cholesterol catabolism regulator [Solirubrobacteraceae bacterium]|nr:TetR/AcrR family transcriptional regulator, cholesterol catabolism regulator [Solirubrobacteraceae bacterium]
MKKSERTRQRILDAAAIEFRDRGFAATRLSDIAGRAELQTPSLYYHFASKEELIEEVMSISVDQTFAHVQASVAEVPRDEPLQRLRVAIEAHVVMSQQTGDYSAANLRLYGQMPADIRDRLLRNQRKVGSYWAGLFKDAQAAGAIRPDVDLSAVRMLTLGALNWATEWYKPSRRLNVEELARTASSMVLDGLKAPG